MEQGGTVPPGEEARRSGPKTGVCKNNVAQPFGEPGGLRVGHKPYLPGAGKSFNVVYERVLLVGVSGLAK